MFTSSRYAISGACATRLDLAGALLLAVIAPAFRLTILTWESSCVTTSFRSLTFMGSKLSLLNAQQSRVNIGDRSKTYGSLAALRFFSVLYCQRNYKTNTGLEGIKFTPQISNFFSCLCRMAIVMYNSEGR